MRAIISILYRSGVRCGEMLALKPHHINQTDSTLRILHGKGDRSRTIGCDPAGLALLEPWMALRASVIASNGPVDSLPVFVTRKAKPLTAGSLRLTLAMLGRRAGIQKRVHAHAFRHTMAVEMMLEGCDVATISRQLGHFSIATTSQYLDHLSPQAVINAMKARKWDPGIRVGGGGNMMVS